jgi:excisionase family DNA binding protein
MEKLLDIDAVADLLSCSPRHVRELQATRRLPSVRAGRLVRFRPADIEKYIDGTVREAVNN